MENQFSFDLTDLHDNPFNRTAAADHPYLSSSFQAALAAVYYGLEYGSRILIVNAARGLGKTTLLRYLERRLRDRGRTLLLSLGHENGRAVLGRLLSQIGSTVTSDDLLVLREQVDAALVQIAKRDKPFMLLLDYDEDGTGSALDVLRNFATLESIEKGLLRVVIAGGPEVAEQLRISDLTDEIITLSRLTASEVRNYIDHRLRLVGWNGAPLFTVKAYTLIAEKSTGMPSVINEICFKLLQNLVPVPIYQRLSALNGARSESRVAEEGFLDESYVEFIDDQRLSKNGIPKAPHVTPLAFAPNRRTAVLAFIALLLAVAIAGFWYRRATKVRSAKHTTVIAPHSLARLQHAAFHDGNRGPLTPQSAMITAGAADVRSIETSGSSAMPPASSLVQHEKPAPSSPIESPTAAGMATRPSSTSNANILEARPADFTSWSAGIATPNKPRRKPAADIAKQDERAISGLTPGVPGPSQRSTSSSGLPQKTSAPTDNRSKSAPEGKDAGSLAAKKIAAYQIRLGDAYMNLGDYDRARTSYSTALGLTPDSKEALDKMRRAGRARAAEESVLR